ncbi:MAG: 50S ribosomal protein L22 [Phycisphaeraceae bacterium]|jgi:large subunit ribosomal protein L22|nr:50S ribosomal protein L22 [Phycisphaeraceae bacterium]
MPYTNIHRGARISPTKVRPVIDLIRGMQIDLALIQLELSKKRAAVFVRSAIEAARANADQAEADTRNLRITDARVDSGPTIKRWQPKDRGRAHPIHKRTCHITITVDAPPLAASQ